MKKVIFTVVHLRNVKVLLFVQWHKKRDESLAHGFMRYSPLDDCSERFSDCPHNRSQTHYHCIQDGCDKVFTSLLLILNIENFYIITFIKIFLIKTYPYIQRPNFFKINIKNVFSRCTYQRLMYKCTRTIIAKTLPFCRKASKGSEQLRAVLHLIVYLLDKELHISTADDLDVHIHSKIKLIWVSLLLYQVESRSKVALFVT